MLPNGLLQDRRLSFTARGLLADLLSRPNGWREDGRQMADTSTQGRGAVRRALKELKDAGYYRVDTVRLPNGTVRSEAHVFDTPQLTSAAPVVPRPAAGERGTGRTVVPSVKNPAEEPTLPDEQTRKAVATLFRAIRPEPRLRLGEAEARQLAPLVTHWLERGCSEAELAHALLPGLPQPMHSPAAILRDRLQRKLPPERSAPPPASYAECGRCHDPVPRPGICRSCAGLGTRTPAVGTGAAATPSGAARARAALRGRGPLVTA
ncbi:MULTISPECIES: hypothetical protein [unclassified Streptomyces]|uniref:hypothetical protein n=1 Tax=unclassified Streptomyces TaxID=2593676 RepID=UPI00211B7E23|nr:MULTISPECIES: hypothetical protein [unclassified Streptomyces]